VSGHAIIVKITGDAVKKIYSWPGDQASGVCAALAKMMDKHDIAVKLLKATHTSLPAVFQISE
jgi:hypothetical protein